MYTTNNEQLSEADSPALEDERIQRFLDSLDPDPVPFTPVPVSVPAPSGQAAAASPSNGALSLRCDSEGCSIQGCRFPHRTVGEMVKKLCVAAKAANPALDLDTITARALKLMEEKLASLPRTTTRVLNAMTRALREQEEKVLEHKVTDWLPRAIPQFKSCLAAAMRVQLGLNCELKDDPKAAVTVDTHLPEAKAKYLMLQALHDYLCANLHVTRGADARAYEKWREAFIAFNRLIHLTADNRYTPMVDRAAWRLRDVTEFVTLLLQAWEESWAVGCIAIYGNKIERGL